MKVLPSVTSQTTALTRVSKLSAMPTMYFSVGLTQVDLGRNWKAEPSWWSCSWLRMSCLSTRHIRLSAVQITLSEATVTPMSRSTSKWRTSEQSPPRLEMSSEVQRLGKAAFGAQVSRWQSVLLKEQLCSSHSRLISVKPQAVTVKLKMFCTSVLPKRCRWITPPLPSQLPPPAKQNSSSPKAVTPLPPFTSPLNPSHVIVRTSQGVAAVLMILRQVGSWASPQTAAATLSAQAAMSVTQLVSEMGV